MRFWKLAKEPGAIKAPTWFTKYLKKEIGEDTECWWTLGATRRAYDSRGRFQWVPGCWVVFKRINVCAWNRIGGVHVGVVRSGYVDIMKLNGNFGTDTGLGRWVVHALKHCDITRRGNSNRFRELDNLHEDETRKEYMDRAKAVDELVNDKLHKRLASKIDDERGSSTLSGDDKKAMNKDQDRRNRLMEAEMEREARLARYYGTR